MRIFFLFFLLAWLIGLGLGVSGIWVLGFGAMAGLALIMWLMRFGWPVITAAALLIALGVVWGDAAVPQDVGQDCGAEIITGRSWTVVDTPTLREDSLRAVVGKDNCLWLASFSPFADINRGDELEISGGERQTLEEVGEWSPGYADYLSRQGISGIWSYPSIVQGAETDSPPLAPPHLRGRKLVNALRGGLVTKVDRLFIEPDASVVKALLLAERGTIPEEMTANFRASGVSHVLAISGLHISLMAGLMLLVLLALPIGPWTRTIILLVVLWLYVGFIGLPASAERAALFWTFALLALRLHWLVSLPTIFWLAVAVMATINPLAMLEVGWQLSVSAVAGIFIALFLTKRATLSLSKGGVVNWIWGLVVVSLGATLATAPLVAYHFGTISLANVAANVLVVPVVPALLITAMLALALSFIFNPLALATAFIFHGLLTWMNWVTAVTANIPGLYLEEVSVSKWQIVIYYLLLAGLAIWWLHKQGRKWREVWG